MSHKSGYPGHDSMREKAVKAFGHQMRDSCHHSEGRVRRNMGGPMGIPDNTADSIQQANQLLANRAGIKSGGKVHRRASGGVIPASPALMASLDFSRSRKAPAAPALKCGGEVVRRAIGGVGKIRHGQSSRTGAQLAPRNRHNGKS